MAASDGLRTDLLSRIDAAPVSGRYWALLGLIIVQLVSEIFDFFVAGFLVSALAPLWKLTFGQTTVILLSAGLGSIVGAVGFGWFSDRFGRKPTVIVSSTLCCLAAGSLAFTPDGQWLVFTLLRFLVGVGYGGAGASQFPLMVEYAPTRSRTLVTSLVGVPVGLGLLAASTVVSTLYPALGWRGTAALGFIPLALPLVLLFVAPESARWLIARGRGEDARKAAASMYRLSPEDVAAPVLAPPASPPASPLQALAYPRRFWLIVLVQLGVGAAMTGVTMWGPTILAQLLRITPQAAAGHFILVSLAGLLGRLIFALTPHRIGRRPTGMIVSFGGAAALALAGMLHGASIAGAPAFLVFLLVAQLFNDGGYSNLNPYGAELYPARLASTGAGVAAAAGGFGKILGPMALGLIAGTSNLISPRATEAAVGPGFLFLAACCVLAGLAWALLGIETHKRALAIA
jgi:putative MFS transporter